RKRTAAVTGVTSAAPMRASGRTRTSPSGKHGNAFAWLFCVERNRSPRGTATARSGSTESAPGVLERFGQHRSEADVVPALEGEEPAGLVWGGGLQAERLQDGADALDLVCVALGEPAGAQPQGVLQADADVGAHGGAHGGERELVAAGAEDGPGVGVAEQPVRGAPHVLDV